VIEKMVDIRTPHGVMNTYVYHPEEDGPHPVVLFYMDSAGVREPLADLCRRLAATGYFVAMPNLYYRDVRWLDIDVDRLGDPAYGATLELMWKLHHTLTPSLVSSDTGAMLEWLDGESAAAPSRIGALGYCMSGRFVFRAAGDFNDRIQAAACLYGVRYFTDEPDSAHLVAGAIRAELYIGMAQHDPYVPADMEGRLARLCAEAGMTHRIEVYPGVEHGFALPGRRVYHKASAERHWERLHALFRRRLGSG
jgi:carboxymethylenebutenolidase